MTHIFQDEKKWNPLTLEEKIEALHKDIGKLFSIAEELSHKHHVIVDAINLIHGRIDSQAKVIHGMERPSLWTEALLYAGGVV